MKTCFAVVVLFMIILTSCSTSGPKYRESIIENTKAVIYVYRDSNIFTSWLDANIYVDNKLISSLPDNSYIVMSSNPGTYTLQYAMEGIGTLTPPITVSTQAGREYYIKLKSAGVIIPDYQNVTVVFEEKYASRPTTNRIWQKVQDLYKKDKVDEIEKTVCAGSYTIGSTKTN